MMLGLIQTQGTMTSLEEKLVAMNANIVKYVTDWGVDERDFTRALAMMDSMWRSKSGDPSADPGNNDVIFPIPQRILEEFKRILNVKYRVWLQIGNEPNMRWRVPVPKDELQNYFYIYRWYLEASLTQCRNYVAGRSLKPTFVSPAFCIDTQHRDKALFALEIMHDVLAKFDVIAWNIYGDGPRVKPLKDKNGRPFLDKQGKPVMVPDVWEQYDVAKELAKKYFPKHRHIITELHVNNPIGDPMIEIKNFLPRVAADGWLGAIMYHSCDIRDINPEYCITLEQARTLGGLGETQHGTKN